MSCAFYGAIHVMAAMCSSYIVCGVCCVFCGAIHVMVAACVHPILCVACYRVLCFFVFHICEGGGACGESVDNLNYEHVDRMGEKLR